MAEDRTQRYFRGKYGESRETRFAGRIPQRANCGDGFFQPCHWFRPLDAVGLVAFTFPHTDTEDGTASGKQMQSRGSLRRDRWIAATCVGHAHAKSQPAESVSGSEVSKHRPRFKDGVNLGHQFRRRRRDTRVSRSTAAGTSSDGRRPNTSRRPSRRQSGNPPAAARSAKYASSRSHRGCRNEIRPHSPLISRWQRCYAELACSC